MNALTSHRMKLNSILFAFLTVSLLSGCGKKADAPSPAPPSVAVNATNQPGPSAIPHPAFEKLKGKWLRPDGGYILEIRSIAPGGKLEAAYLNPRPINVARAEASQEGETAKVFIELRDVNYPGSTYTLTYDAASDRLNGIYFQAALKQNFDVSFSRMNP
jgi:hypothetical protein